MSASTPSGPFRRPTSFAAALVFPCLNIAITLFSSIGHADQTLEQKLVSGLLAHPSAIKTLSRDIIVYHWASRQNLGLPPTGPVDPRSPNMKGALNFIINTSNQPAALLNAAGEGLYLAIDPVASASYAGIGVLRAAVQVIMRRGTRYIDLAGMTTAPYNQIPFSQEIAAELSQKGCTANSYYSLVVFGNRVPACVPFKHALIEGTGVSAIRYSFTAYPFPDCPQRPPVAFVAVRPEGIDFDTAVVFTVDTPNDGLTENRLMLNEMFVKSGVTGSFTSPGGQPVNVPFPTLQQFSTQVNMPQWRAQFLMGCGNHPEETPAPVL